MYIRVLPAEFSPLTSGIAPDATASPVSACAVEKSDGGTDSQHSLTIQHDSARIAEAVPAESPAIHRRAHNSTLPARSRPMKRSPLAKVSKKQRAKNRDYESAKKIVRERSGGRCEYLTVHPGDTPPSYRSFRCTERATQFHHRRRRGQGGEHTPENLLHLCAGCHDRIHANPAQSYASGLLIRSSSPTNSPAPEAT
jgi:hypothetical protein